MAPGYSLCQTHTDLGALAFAVPSAWNSLTPDICTGRCHIPGETPVQVTLSEQYTHACTHFKQNFFYTILTLKALYTVYLASCSTSHSLSPGTHFFLSLEIHRRGRFLTEKQNSAGFQEHEIWRKVTWAGMPPAPLISCATRRKLWLPLCTAAPL